MKLFLLPILTISIFNLSAFDKESAKRLRESIARREKTAAKCAAMAAESEARLYYHSLHNAPEQSNDIAAIKDLTAKGEAALSKGLLELAKDKARLEELEAYAAKSVTERHCANCLKTSSELAPLKLARCSGSCKVAHPTYYCGIDCQIRDKETHRERRDCRRK